jgi:hypothetical protein
MFYLVNEFSHFCNSGSSFFEALKVVWRENEVSFFPLRKKLVTLLPQQALLDGGSRTFFLKEK